MKKRGLSILFYCLHQFRCCYTYMYSALGPRMEEARNVETTPDPDPISRQISTLKREQILWVTFARYRHRTGPDSATERAVLPNSLQSRITEYPELEGTHEDHPVQPLALHRHPNNPNPTLYIPGSAVPSLSELCQAGAVTIPWGAFSSAPPPPGEESFPDIHPNPSRHSFRPFPPVAESTSAPPLPLLTKLLTVPSFPLSRPKEPSALSRSRRGPSPSPPPLWALLWL